MKKITKATIKSFIKKNEGKLFIKKLSSFDGMQDCVMPDNDSFSEVQKTTFNQQYNLGIKTANFVGGDRYTQHEDDTFTGYKVYNCCGSFILAVEKEVKRNICSTCKRSVGSLSGECFKHPQSAIIKNVSYSV